MREYSRSLPFVAQQWIEGTVETLRFGVAYLDRGRVLASFEGRKAYAGPDGLGQATTMEPWPDPAVREATIEFLRDRELSGPVAVEFKRGADGRLWMIEPNVGRTEYCVDVCIGNGFDLPWFEYCHVAGLDLPPVGNQNRRIWFDCDRDRLSWLRYLARHPTDSRPIDRCSRLRDTGPRAAQGAACSAVGAHRGGQGARRHRQRRPRRSLRTVATTLRTVSPAENRAISSIEMLASGSTTS